MNISKKPVALLSAAAVAGLIIAAVSTPVSAKTTALAVGSTDTKTYEYNYDALKASAIQSALGNQSGAALYNDFMTRNNGIKAFYDDVKKAYVSSDDVNKAAVAAALANKDFVLDTFTEATTTATTPVTSVKVATDANGNLTLDGQVVIAVKTVSAITVPATNVGVVPTLPTTVNVTLTDGTTKTANITWNEAAKTAGNYATAGTVTVNGTLADYSNYAVSASVTVNAAPTTLSVSSVSAVNLKQVQVVFNNTVDKTSAETLGNYVVSTPLDAVGAANVTTTVANATLQADGKTVILTLTGSYANQFTAKTISISNVKDTNGTVLASTYTKADLAGTDTTIPSVTSVKVVGPQTIDVYFSEPVTTAAAGSYTTAINTGDFAIDNGSMSVSAAVASYDKSKVTLTLSSALPAGDHSVIVNNALGIHDFAGYSVVKSTQSFSYAAVTAAPTASVSSATPSKVVLKFSTPVKNVGSAAFYHDFSNLIASGAATATTGTNFTGADGATYSDSWDVPFATNLLTSAGTLNIKNLVGTEIQDLYGNKFADTTLAVTPVADTTAPTVVSVTASDNKTIKVKFSKDVNPTYAKNSQYYVFKDSNGTVLNSSTVTNLDAYGHPTGTIAYDANTYTATIPFATAIANGTYQLTTKDIQDTVTYTTNKLAENTKTFTVANTTLATLQSAVKSGNTFVLTYSKAVATSGTGSALDINNYRIDWDGAGATYTTSKLPEGSTVAIGASNNTVVITCADTTNYSTGVSLISAAVNDSTGTAIDSFANSHSISNAVGIASTEVGNIRLIDNKTVTFEVMKPLKSVNAGKILIGGTPVDSATFVNKTLSDGVTYGALVTAKISTTWLGAHGGANYLNTSVSATPALTIGGVDTALTFTAGGAFTDLQDTLSAATAVGFVGSTIKDYAAPTYTAATVGAAGKITTINVAFSEAILAGTVSTGSFTVDGYTVTNVDVNGTAGTATITVTPKSVSDSGVTPTITLTKSVTDASAQGNVEAVDTASTAVTPTDGVAPLAVLPAATGTDNSATKLVATFGEPLYIAGVAVADGADVKTSFTAEAGNTITSAIYSATNKTVTFTFSAVADGKKVTHNADATKLTDKAGIAYAAKAYTYTAAGTIWASN
jgi:hypothetical protein